MTVTVSPADVVTAAATTVGRQWAAAAVTAFTLARLCAHRRIQTHRAAADQWKHLRHELLYSFLTLSLAGSVIALTVRKGVEAGAITLFTPPSLSAGLSPLTVATVVAEIVLYFCLFEAYFYGLHRAFHRVPWLWRFHAAHHVSHTPNALSAFSFHPVEGLVFGSFLPGFLLVSTNVLGHPVSLPALVTVAALQVVQSLLIHSGFEVVNPASVPWLITATHHDRHHSHPTHNFGGFFTLPDKWCGTEYRGGKVA